MIIWYTYDIWYSNDMSRTLGAKTINVFRACLSNFVLFSTVSLRFVLSQVFFLYSLGPRTSRQGPFLTTLQSVPSVLCPGTGYFHEEFILM